MVLHAFMDIVFFKKWACLFDHQVNRLHRPIVTTALPVETQEGHAILKGLTASAARDGIVVALVAYYGSGRGVAKVQPPGCCAAAGHTEQGYQRAKSLAEWRRIRRWRY